MKEIGGEIKSYTELNGRKESNMIDSLNALYNYDLTKKKLKDHMLDKEKLSLIHYKNEANMKDYEMIINDKLQSKVNAIEDTFSEKLKEDQPLPDYTKKIKTMNSIPPHLYSALPSKLTFMVD